MCQTPVPPAPPSTPTASSTHSPEAPPPPPSLWEDLGENFAQVFSALFCGLLALGVLWLFYRGLVCARIVDPFDWLSGRNAVLEENACIISSLVGVFAYSAAQGAFLLWPGAFTKRMCAAGFSYGTAIPLYTGLLELFHRRWADDELINGLLLNPLKVSYPYSLILAAFVVMTLEPFLAAGMRWLTKRSPRWQREAGTKAKVVLFIVSVVGTGVFAALVVKTAVAKAAKDDADERTQQLDATFPPARAKAK